MTDLEVFAQSKIRPRGKLAPHAKDIRTLREMGLTLGDIQEFLAIKNIQVSIPALSKFFAKRGVGKVEQPEALGTPSSRVTDKAKTTKIFREKSTSPSSTGQPAPAWLPEDSNHLADDLY